MTARRDDKQRILFLATDVTGTAQLDREARSIQAELAATGHRDCFDFVTRWATEPLDLLRELRMLKPTVVHFSGYGGALHAQPASSGAPDGEGEHRQAGEEAETGLYFVGRAGKAQWVSIAAIANTFGAAGTSVKLVILNARYNDAQADALLHRVPCGIWMPRTLNNEAARSFAIGFYGGLGDGASLDSAYKHGSAAIGLAGLPNTDLPRLRARPGVDAAQLIFAVNQMGGTASVAPGSVTDRLTRTTLRHKDSRRRSIAMRIRTAFADGQGAYMLAMLAFGVAATFLYRSLQPERSYHKALDRLLTPVSVQEPFRAETHPVLATGLLSSAGLLSNEAWDLCKNEDLLKSADDLVRRFTTALSKWPSEGYLSSDLKQCDISNECPYDTALGYAWTDNAFKSNSTLMIPSTIAKLVNADPATKKILLASEVIEKYNNDLGSNLGNAMLKNMYFVSVAGAIRLIPKWVRNNLPAHRTFAGSAYMYETLLKKPSGSSLACSGHDGTLTRVYFDLVGMGMVRTLCHQIISKDQVVGILCFDFSPTEQAIYQMFDKRPHLFDLQLVRFYDQGSPESCEEIEGCPKSLAALSDKVDDLEKEWINDSHQAADGTSTMRSLEHNQYFGAIVQRMAKTQVRSGGDVVVFGRVQRSPARDLSSAVMTLMFAIIASGLILSGVRKKAKRLDVALIRSLQVGVVELDIRDTIVGANDRAQEIFGVELPAFDLPKRHSARPFGSLIHKTIVRLDDAGLLPPGPVTFSRYESLMLERAVGHSSSYYAITTLSKQIIRISGSTFVNPNMGVHTFGTIETFVDPTHRSMVLAAFEALADAARRSTGKESV